MVAPLPNPALVQAAQEVARWKAAGAHLHDLPLDAFSTCLALGIEASRQSVALLRTKNTCQVTTMKAHEIVQLLKFDLQLHSTDRLEMLGFRALGANMRVELEGNGWAADERAQKWGRALALVKEHDEVMQEIKRALEQVDEW